MGKIYPMIGYCDVKRKPIGIQWVQDGNTYTAAGSYTVTTGENVAHTEEMQGEFYIAHNYKCRYCGKPSLYQCGNCKTFVCWDGIADQVVCPKCNYKQNLSGTVTSAKGSSGQ